MIKIAEYKDELYIITNIELEKVKNRAQILLSCLPDDYNNALIVIQYLKEVMESETGKKVKGIKILNKR